MSYCVNCGVKLAASEKVCPLCTTPVVNPNEIEREEYYPYPQKVEKIRKTVNRRFMGILGTIALSIPIVVALILQIIQHFAKLWELYLYGAAILTFCYVLLPMLIKKPNPYICLSIDGIATALYVALIAWINGDMVTWYLPFALPVIGELFVYICVSLLISRIKRLGNLPKAAIIIAMFGALSVVFETVLALTFYDDFKLIWCWFVVAVFGIISGLLFIVNSRTGWIDMLRRKLFT